MNDRLGSIARGLSYAFTVATGCVLAGAADAEAGRPWWLAEPVRGVWMANVGSDSLYTAEGIVRAVERCDAAGINTIFVVTWNRGDTLYPSDVMQREFDRPIEPRLDGRDPLAELIDAAHARGIRVVAWFEFGFASSYRRPDGGRLLRARPEWAALDAAGDIVSRNGFQWMNAFDPAVQDFLLAMLKETVQRYDLDGVQGDDRLPALPNTGGYDPLTVSLYRADHDGRDPPQDVTDPAWTQWRADRLSRFVERAYGELKAVDPEVCVSWAPSVWPWSQQNYLQDWPRWAREGWGDLFCPQVYRKSPAAYAKTLGQIVPDQVPAELRDRIAPGMLIALADGYDLPEEDLRAMVAANRAAGYRGEVYFYHGGLEEHGETIRSLYQPAE